MEGNVGLWAAGLGTGLAAIGGGIGIGKVCAAALEGMARQPSATNDLRLAMLVGASYIEGAVLFALVVNILIIYA